MLKQFILFLFICCANIVIAQTGKNCSEAIFLNSDDCSSSIGFDNSTLSGGVKGSCNTTGNNNTMWFSFIAGSNSIIFDVTGSTLNNPIVTVYNTNGSNCENIGGFSELYCGVSGSDNLKFTLNNLNLSQVYYLTIDGAGNSAGLFQACMKSSNTPYNDEICQAITIPTKNFCTPYGTFSNIGALPDLTVGNTNFFPPCFDNDILNGVWFKFVAETNYINLEIIGAPNGLTNPQIALLTPPANDCARTDYWNYVQIACDRNTDNTNTASLTQSSLTIGQTYYLLVDGINENTGFFNICAKDKMISGVVNDFCVNAIDLCPFQSVSGTTIGASNTNDIPSTLWNGCNIETNDMVYYKFSTSSPVSDVYIDIAYSCTGAKLQVAVFEPTAPPCSGANDNWNNIICVEEGFLPQFQVIIPAASMSPNTTYYLVIDDYPNYECSFDLTIRGNAGPMAGFDQQVCSTKNPFNLTGFSPTGGSWSGPGIIDINTGRFSPALAGVGNHTVYYQIGECYDTKNITVSTADIYVSEDQEICNGDSTQIFGQAFARPSRTIKTFTNNSEAPLPDNVSSFTRAITVANIDPNVFDVSSTFARVCVNMVHQRSKDLQLALESPTGERILLSRANGSAGMQYLNTCFVEQAPQNISDGSFLSFNGNFQPEESLNALNGLAINGDWKLIIDDIFNGNSGTFYNWEIAFFDRNTLNTSITPWNPNNNISNRNINNPIVYPNSTQTYTYVAIDKLNCGSNNAIEVNVVPTEIISIATNASEICEGDSAVISVITPAGKTYNITLSDGSNNYNLPTAQNGSTFELYPSITSDFQLTTASLVGVGANCVKPDDKIIRIAVLPAPSVVFDSIIDACPGSQVSINYQFFPSTPLTFTIDTGAADITVNNFTANPYQFSVTANQTFEYVIKTIAYENSPFCRTDLNEGTIIRVPDSPVVTISGDSVYCEGDVTSITFTIDQSATFDMTLNINGNDTIVQGITSPYTFNMVANQLTTINLTNLYNATLGCNYAQDELFNFSIVPKLDYTIISDTCLANRTGANVKFEISGGDAGSYFVNSNPTDSIYEEFVPTGFGYNFVISDNSPCSNLFFNGLIDCSCKSFAGTMSTSLLKLCENETAQFNKPTDRVLEANDTLVFVLHEGNTTNLGNILDHSFVGDFNFLGSMQLGSQYWVSSVVGNRSNSFIGVDTSDICLSISSTPIMFTQKPSIQITGPDSICLGDDAVFDLTIAGKAPFNVKYNYNGNTNTLSNINTNSNLTLTPSVSGNLTIEEITSVNPSCIVSPDSVLSLVVIDRPIAKNVTITCIGSDLYTVSFDVEGGNPNDYNITGGNFIPIGSRKFVSDTLPSPSYYSFTIEHGGNCPDAIVSGFNNCNCTSEPGTMDQTLINVCGNDTAFGVYDYNYVFDNNDDLTFILHDSSGFNIGQIFDQNTVPNFTFKPGMVYNTTYYISGVVGNSDASTTVDFDDECTVAAQGTPVIFRPQPTITKLQDLTVCKGYLSYLPIEVSGNAPFTIDYQVGMQNGSWTINNNVDSIPITLDSTTVFNLTFINDGSSPMCGSPLNKGISVTVKPLPTIQVTANDSICVGYDLTVNVALSGTSLFALDIEGPNNFSQNFNNLTSNESITFRPVSSGNYYITNMSDGGNPSCVNDSSFIIPVEIIGKPNIIMTTSDVCEGDSVPVQLNFTGTSPFYVTIHDDENASSDLNDTIQYIVSGTDTLVYHKLNNSEYVYVFNYYDSNPLNCPFEGFSPSNFVNVNVNPFISINYANTICSGNAVNIPITLTGNGPFDVILSQNGIDTNLILDNSDQFITVSPVENTTYYIKQITDRTSTNCSFTGIDSAFIDVNPSPTGNLITDDSVCENDFFDVNITLVGTPNFNYILSFNNSTLSNASSGNSSESIQLNESSWIILSEVIDGANPTCTSLLVDSIYVMVNPLPNLTLNGPSEVCANEDWVIEISGYGTEPYELTFSHNGEETIFSNVTNSDQVIFNPASDGNYILTQITDNANPTCQTTPNDTLLLNVKNLPSVNFDSSPTDGCSPWPVSFTPIINTDSVDNVLWRFGDGGQSVDLTPAHKFRAGQHDVTLTAYGKNGCENSALKPNYVFAYPLPKANFEANPNPVGSLNPKVTFYDDVIGGNPTKWIFDSLAVDSINFPVTFTFPVDKQADYQVSLFAINQYGCVDLITKTINVIGELTLYVPNAFTPNGDGVNDVFKPVLSGERENSYRFSIYNRWGEEIFRSERLNEGWNGQHAGTKSPSGIYTWRVYAKSEFGAESIFHSGLVTLLR
jgi:gliding motility-associated-like protein